MRRVNSLVCLCMSFLFLESASKEVLRIIGGRDSKPNEFPYAVRLEEHVKDLSDKGNNPHIAVTILCTGAALSATWTLTAAHCIELGANSTKFMNGSLVEITILVNYGDPHIKDNNNNLCKILEIQTLHNAERNDIALIKTETVDLDKYAKVSALDSYSLYGLKVDLLGYGLMLEKDRENLESSVKLNMPLQVMNAMLRSCDQKPTHLGSAICAVPPCGQFQTPAFGDTGGPVVHESGIVAVMRRREGFVFIGDHLTQDTGRLTPVNLYLDWISATVKSY